MDLSVSWKRFSFVPKLALNSTIYALKDVTHPLPYLPTG